MGNDSQREVDTDRILEQSISMGITLFQVSIHDNPCSKCAPYQGKVFSVQGDPKFPPLLARPPFCSECRHVLLPYVPRPNKPEQHEALSRFSMDPNAIVKRLPDYHKMLAEATKGPIPPIIPEAAKASISNLAPPVRSHQSFKMTKARTPSCLGRVVRASLFAGLAFLLIMIVIGVFLPTPSRPQDHKPVVDPNLVTSQPTQAPASQPVLPEVTPLDPAIMRITTSSDGTTPLYSQPTLEDDEEIARIPSKTSMDVIEWTDHKQGKSLTRFFKVLHKGKEGWVNQYFTDGFVYSETGGKTNKEEIPGMKGMRRAPPTDEEKAKTREIEKQFSPWDGSHREFVSAIKATMNDPDSFEHVETKFWEYDDHTMVMCTFRGKNAFGGVVTQTYYAKVSIEGKVLEVTK